MSEKGETTERKIPCRVFSRVVGYLTSVDTWHRAKQQEMRDRVPFDVKELREPTLDE